MSTAKEFQYLQQIGYNGSIADKRNAYYTDLITNGGQPDLPTVGEITPTRDWYSNNVPLTTSGNLLLSYATAVRTEAINTLTTYSGTNAAGATPTLCRVGVYSVAANGDLTLIAACANDTALWAATNTAYPKALTSTFNKVAGQRYAYACICVSAAGIPSLCGNLHAIANVPFISPRVCAVVSGQADLPASIVNGSIGMYSRHVGFVLS